MYLDYIRRHLRFRAPQNVQPTGIRRLPDYVYYCKCQDGGTVYIKIGKSRAPLDRLSEVQVGCPIRISEFGICEVSLWGALVMERRFQAALKPFHSRGEWFKFSPETLPNFEACCRRVFERWIGTHGHWTELDLEHLRTEVFARGLEKKHATLKSKPSFAQRREIAQRRFVQNMAEMEAKAKKASILVKRQNPSV